MFDILAQNIIASWLVIGGIFILIEAMAITGVGFLFAGLAAITTGGLIQFEQIAQDQYSLQATVFLASSFLWVAILWLPLKSLNKKRKSLDYANIVGDNAIIYKQALVKGKIGEVKWSGTIMNAVLANNSLEEKLDENTAVKIVEIDGNILKVIKK